VPVLDVTNTFQNYFAPPGFWVLLNHTTAVRFLPELLVLITLDMSPSLRPYSMANQGFAYIMKGANKKSRVG
jgi:hypothetical protein